MNEKNNIDKIFKNAAQQYSATAPKGAWGSIDASLKAQSRMLFIKKLSVAAVISVVSIVAAVVVFNSSDIDVAQLDDNTNTTPKNTLNTKSEQVTDNTISYNDDVPKLETKNKEIIVEANTEAIVNNANSVVVENIAIDNKSEVSIVAVEKTPNKISVAAVDKENNVEKSIHLNKLIENIDEDIVGSESIDIDSKVAPTIIKETQESIISINEKSTNDKLVIETKVIENSSIEETPIQEQEKLINKSILEEIAINEDKPEVTIENEVINPEELKNNNTSSFKYFIGSTISAAITNAVSVAPATPNKDMAVAGSVNTEIGYGASVDIGIRKDNWIFTTGIRRYDHKVSGDFTVNEHNPYNVDADNYGYSALGVISLFNVNTNARLANPSSAIYVQDFDEYSIRLRYVDIPITIGYELKINNWSVIPYVGINSTIILSNEVKMSKDDKIFMYGEVKDVNSIMLGITTGGGLYYNIGKRWLLGLNTDFIYYPSSVSYSKDYTYKPYSLLVGPRVEFRF